MAKENPQQLMELLSNNHGIIFFPKRPLRQPILSENSLLSLFRKEDMNKARHDLSVLTNYLGGQAVGDQLGKDHERRRKWRAELAKQYGQTFLDLYYTNNQFRGNRISLVRLSIYDLGDCIEANGNKELGDTLHQIADELKAKMAGEDPKTHQKIDKKYDDIESLDEKLKIVYFFEETILQVLNSLSQIR